MDSIQSVTLNNIEIQENGIIRNSSGYLIGRLSDDIDYNGEHIKGNSIASLPNTSSEVEKEIRQCFVDTEMEHDEELTLFDTDETIKRIVDLFNTELHQSEIKGRINALEELPITEIKESNGRRTNCVLSEEIYKAIGINKFLNQMKGKDK